jgi:DNA-binding transcriptional MocR family regulator
MQCRGWRGTGDRHAWLVDGNTMDQEASPALHAQVQLLKFITSGGVSELVQLSAARYLETGGYERLLRTLRSTYAKQMELVRNSVFRHFP